MCIVNGIAYADTKEEEKKVLDVKPLADLMMIVTFQSWEKRLFDASYLLQMPAFKDLCNAEIFDNPVIDHGVVTWNDGEIDIAPETIYANSFKYSS